MPASIYIRHDLDRLANTLGAIARETGKDGRALVADATVQVAIGGNGIKGLLQEYRALAPKKGAIKSAPWGAGKTFNAFGERDSTGVSIPATDRARELLRGAPAGYFRVGARRIFPLGVAPAGTRTRARLVNARESRRGKYNRLAIATAGTARGAIKPAGAKLLNLRALSVYFEINQRESSRGYLARQFVTGIPRKIAPDTPAAAYAARRKDGKVIGSVSYAAAREAASGRILGLVEPNSKNTEAINRRVLAAVIRDKEQYLSRKLLENFSKIR